MSPKLPRRISALNSALHILQLMKWISGKLIPNTTNACTKISEYDVTQMQVTEVER